MISVKLIAKTDLNPDVLASHAAKVCYTATVPEVGSLLDVKGRLFDPGHHTTLEHTHWTFCLDGLSVSSVAFGLHLNAPYYNTDQRSGRFSKMYQNPNMDEIKAYLDYFYPNEKTDKALAFVEKGCKIYAENIEGLTRIAADMIRQERPLAGDKYIEQNAPKFAQEQLRGVMSQIMPTALDITLNISALCALWREAWSPEMRFVTDKMRDEVLREYPNLSHMFDETKRKNQDWSPDMTFDKTEVKNHPTCRLISTGISDYIPPKMTDSVDILPFSPLAMAGNVIDIKTQVEISAATMGQDQRHRSIKRTAPCLTGGFYLPPLLEKAGLYDVAADYMNQYAELRGELSGGLMTAIMPYGVLLTYEKNANLNALLHEQGKRLCWCAQEEISEISRQLRDQIQKVNPKIAELLAPPCYHSGKCAEGVRFCGRQIREQRENYFIRRRV